MAIPTLSSGALHKIICQNCHPNAPALQIVQIRELSTKTGGSKRYDIALSDGQYFVRGIPGLQLNQKISNESVKAYNVIQLTNYSVNEIGDKKVIVITNFELLSVTPCGVLDSPAPIVDDNQPPLVSSRIKTDDFRSGAMDNKIVSIAALNSFMDTNWTLQAKIVHKSQMKSWANPRGQGNLFSIILKDKLNSEIRGTFFKADAHRWYPLLELAKVYIVTGGQIKAANRKFSNVQNDYEILFDSTTHFDETIDDNGFGERSYKFLRSLRDLQTQKENALVDVIAIVKDVEKATDIITTKRQTQRRRIFLCDASGVQIEMTLWDQNAERMSMESIGCTIQIKDARVCNFRGKQLSSMTGTVIDFTTMTREAQELQHWWTTGGDQHLFQNLSTNCETVNSLSYLATVNERRLGTKKDIADFFTFYGLICDVLIRQGCLLYYNACPNPGCKNKKIDENNGMIICKICGQAVNIPRERFVFSFRAADFTGGGIINVLGDDTIGQSILGCTAREWAEATRNEEVEVMRKRFSDTRFVDFKIKVRVKGDEYNGNLRPKMIALMVTLINYAEAAKFLASEILKF
jgi:replication factor A1